MRVNRIALSLVVAAGLAVQGAASAQENRGTMEQQMACTPDVWRLCFDQIPDAGRITACLRQNTPQLSGACRAVFESNASVSQQQQTAQTAPQARRRQAQPRVYEVQPAPRVDDDQ
jgi:hypothetical protein